MLSQTDLYLLNTDLHINPIISHNGETDFHLVFNLATGRSSIFSVTFEILAQHSIFHYKAKREDSTTMLVNVISHLCRKTSQQLYHASRS